MEKREQLYEGKAKKVYATDDPDLVIVSYKDDATALNGKKRGTIAGKGVINNKVTNYLMQMLEKEGVPTHFVQELSDRDTLVKKVSIVPLEVIVRNISAGHFASRYGVEEGIVFDTPTIEFSYKCDALDDPLLNEYHALALKLATKEEIETIKAMLSLMDNVSVKAVSHITGGGFFENIPRSLPAGFSAKIEKAAVKTPPVFSIIAKAGNIPERDMGSGNGYKKS